MVKQDRRTSSGEKEVSKRLTQRCASNCKQTPAIRSSSRTHVHALAVVNTGTDKHTTILCLWQKHISDCGINVLTPFPERLHLSSIAAARGGRAEPVASK